MNRSGLEDPEQTEIMQVPARRHLHDPQKPELNSGSFHDCMLKQEDELTLRRHSLAPAASSYDRLEGEVLISNRQKAFQEAAASNRHSCLGEAPSAWRGPKTLESKAPEAFLDPSQRTDLAGAKLSGELSDVSIMGLMKPPGNLSRTCRICNKQFPSGRALGGHMRVHGPLFAPSSRSSYGVGRPAANFTHREDVSVYTARDTEDDGSTPLNSDARHAAEILEQNSPLNQDAMSAQASTGHCDGAYSMLLDRDNGYAAEVDAHHAESDEEKDLNEKRFLSLASYNSQISQLDEDTREANPTVRPSKSLLYKLRHNPKRSRWFADQQFAFDASMANLGGKNFPPVEGGYVCSECGKAFWSERALFGHMRCHPDRDRRIALTPGDSMNSEQPVVAMARQRRKLNQSVADKFMQSAEMQLGSKKGEFQKRLRGAEIEALPVEIKNEASFGNSAIEDNIGSEEPADKIEGQALVACKEQQGCIFSGIINDEEAPARWRSGGRRSRRKVGSNKTGNSSSSPEDEPTLTSETISFELGVEEQEIQTPDFLILLADAAQKIEEESELPARIEKSFRLCTDSVKKSKPLQDDGACHYEDTHEDVSLVHNPLVTGMSNGKYECATCKKSFNSHQALGGHRASHKKTKGCFARTGSSTEASEEHLIEEELDLYYGQEKGRVNIPHKKSRQRDASAFKGHACSICHRVFLTGQALGGHKRCHWTGEKPSEAASIASTNKQLSLQSEGQSVVEGGIDLNMPAPMDDDADEVGFVPLEMHSVKSEVSDQEAEVEKVNVVGSDLLLGTSAMAQALKDSLENNTRSSSLGKETEARHIRFGIWGQHWPDNFGVTHELHLPVYAMQSSV
ncbi:hypothetical protein L7F22_000571 [Adiantum nelumboides]|nr:hypothetical protein [Adiantum nelumboides]